jgi:hypothetical protein
MIRLDFTIGGVRFRILQVGDRFWALSEKPCLGMVALDYPAALSFEAARDVVYAAHTLPADAPAWLMSGWKQQVDRAIEEAQAAL